MVFEFLEKILAPIGLVLSPIFSFNPIVSVFIFSVFLTGIIMLINRFAVNRKKMKEIKDGMAQIRENLTKAQKEGNAEETKKFFNEYMKANSHYMKQTFRALAISMVVVILLFPVLSAKYKGMVVATLPFSLPFLGSNLGWLWWYFLVSFAVGWVARKIIGE